MQHGPVYLDPFSHPPNYRPYNPARQLGAAATPAASCPTRPLWWLLVAAGVGAAVGFQVTERKKGRGR